MSQTSRRSRISTSPRGYYNFDLPIVPKRGRSIKIVTTDLTAPPSPASSSSSLSLSRPYTSIPHAPEPPSPNYQSSHRRSPSFTRERRVITAHIETRSPEYYSETPSRYTSDTQGELAHFYKRQVQASREPQRTIEIARPAKPSSHRPKSASVQQSPQRYELAVVPVQYRDQAIIVERSPWVDNKPVVVEKKQTIMMKDDQGRWCKVRRVVR